MKKLLPLVFLIAACSGRSSGGSNGVASGAALRNVDVTIVYPLPKTGRLGDLPAPAESDVDAPYLPASAFIGGVPDLDVTRPVPASDRKASLRVVAIRFDPCPGVVATKPLSGCAPAMRVVLQSLYDEKGEVGARDGAAHAFYRLSPSDFAAALTELRAIRGEHASDPESALSAHPVLVAEGLNGAYAVRLRGLLTRNATKANLVRVTHFARTSPDVPTWEFGISDLTGGSFQASKIASTSTTKQTLTTISGGRWDAVIMPGLSTPDDVTAVFKVATKEEMKAKLVASVHVLNPRVHTSETIDCASCHIAPDVASFLRGTQMLDVNAEPDHFVSTYPVSAASISDDDAIAFTNIHMLSYLGTTLNVSPRAANETAAVLEALNDP